MTFTDLMAYWRYESLPEDAEQVKKYRSDLHNRLEKLSLVQQLKGSGFVEVFPGRRKDDQLVDKTLLTPGAIAIPPKFYYNPDKKEIVGVYHMGMKLTGYPFIVHGGILATIMEDLMRESVKLIKQKEGEKTKELSVSYMMPTFANQFVFVRTTSVENLGKNIKLKVDLLDQNGSVLVKGAGTFST